MKELGNLEEVILLLVMAMQGGCLWIFGERSLPGAYGQRPFHQCGAYGAFSPGEKGNGRLGDEGREATGGGAALFRWGGDEYAGASSDGAPGDGDGGGGGEGDVGGIQCVMRSGVRALGDDRNYIGSTTKIVETAAATHCTTAFQSKIRLGRSRTAWSAPPRRAQALAGRGTAIGPFY